MSKRGANIRFKKRTILVSGIIFLLIAGVVIIDKIVIIKKPSVILITIDALRPDHLGCYGYHRDTSKNIDRLAHNSYIFTNAFAQAPSTRPTIWGILTSKYKPKIPLPAKYVTIAEYFKTKRYNTAAFIAQHLLDSRKSDVGRGFDIFDSEYAIDANKSCLRTTSSMTDAAIKWLGQNKSNSVFIWMHCFDPHDPYVPPPEYRGYYNKTATFSGDRRAEGIIFKSRPISKEHRDFLINAYDEEIRYCDHEIGRFFDYLKKINKYNNTIIIITSDHGEELGDNGNRWDHCQLLSQEELHVPLIIKMPGQTGGVKVNGIAQSIDIYPTLVNYFDKTLPQTYSNQFEGVSLIPLMKKKETGDDRFAMSLWCKQKSFIKGRYKYWFRDGKDYLIDIKSGKEIDNPALMKEMKNELKKIYNRNTLKMKYDMETVRQLKSVGYLN